MLQVQDPANALNNVLDSVCIGWGWLVVCGWIWVTITLLQAGSCPSVWGVLVVYTEWNNDPSVVAAALTSFSHGVGISLPSHIRPIHWRAAASSPAADCRPGLLPVCEAELLLLSVLDTGASVGCCKERTRCTCSRAVWQHCSSLYPLTVSSCCSRSCHSAPCDSACREARW